MTDGIRRAPLDRVRVLLFRNLGLKLVAVVVSLVVYGLAHRPPPPPPEPAAANAVCPPQPPR